jgi:hypothetical protein
MLKNYRQVIDIVFDRQIIVSIIKRVYIYLDLDLRTHSEEGISPIEPVGFNTIGLEPGPVQQKVFVPGAGQD